MGQFDVCRNPAGGAFPLLLDVQAELLSDLTTRVVVPMMPRTAYGRHLLTRLNPTARIAGVEYVLVFQELAAIRRADLGDRVASLASRRDELVAALDLLLTGI